MLEEVNSKRRLNQVSVFLLLHWFNTWLDVKVLLTAVGWITSIFGEIGRSSIKFNKKDGAAFICKESISNQSGD